MEVFPLKNKFLGDRFQNFRIHFIFHGICFIGSGSISFSRGSASMVDSRWIFVDLDQIHRSTHKGGTSGITVGGRPAKLFHFHFDHGIRIEF